MRARDVSRPTATELAAAELTADAIVAALARRSTSWPTPICWTLNCSPVACPVHGSRPATPDQW